MIVRRLSIVAVLALVALVAAQVGRASAQEADAIQISQHAVFGEILTDADGNTLYLFTDDELNVSNCTGGCATAWPPLLTTGDPIAGEGLSQDRLTTTEREDGTTQVVYNGWPLYYFQNDEEPGDTTGQYGTWFVVSAFGGPIQTSAAVNVAENPDFGTILVEASGRTLYLFTTDEREKSNCSGGCATAWPPLLTIEDPTAGEGVNADRLGTITREDGSTQVVYNGWPLYYFPKDEGPGDTAGQYGQWFVVSPFGGPIQTNAAVNMAENPDFGTILVEASGRSLYLFTTDEREKSNCSGGCATAWPPLLTVGDPTAGEGVDADRLGTITREDGSTQTTYNGWPLYYFFRDQGPGDTAGQYGQWFVVSTDGGPIHTNATVKTVEDPALGTILVDASGRSLYLFTKDGRNASNCSGGCALAWPPLLTVDDAMAESPAVAAWLGTTPRPDGHSQVTYNGVPLYYFANDEKPGDTNGQTVGDVWFVVDPIGGAVGMPESMAPTPAPATSGAAPALISVGDAELPSVGDSAVPSLARWGLISSLALIGVGGVILIRRKPRLARL